MWVSEWVEVAQSCLTLCDPTDCSVHGVLQARILEWGAFPFSMGSSQPRHRTQVSCTAGEFFTSWAIREAPDNVNHPELYIHPLLLNLPPSPSCPPPIITAWASVLRAASHQLPLSPRGRMYLDAASSLCPSSPSPTVSTSPFSRSASPFLPWKQVHQDHFSRFHTYIH